MTTTVKQGPVGALSSYAAPAMTTMMVSLPTPTNDATIRYWKFTAPQTGRVLLDTRLSTGDTLNSYLTTPGVYTSSFDFDENGDPVVAGGAQNPLYGTDARFLDAVAGTTYIIGVYQLQQYDYVKQQYNPLGLVQHVLRISDYGRVVKGSVPNQKITVLSQASYYDTDTSTQKLRTGYMQSGGEDVVLTADLTWQGQPSGSYEIHRALGGPNPGMVQAARHCAWSIATTMAGPYGQWWGGNDPDYHVVYDDQFAHSPDACRLVGAPDWGGDDVYGYPGGPSGLIGYYSRAYSTLWWYNDLDYSIYHMRFGCSIDNMRGSYTGHRHFDWLVEEFGNEAVGGDGAGYSVVWDDWYAMRNQDHEHPLPGDIVNLWWSPDEYNTASGDLESYSVMAALNTGAPKSSGDADHFARPDNYALNYPIPVLEDPPGVQVVDDFGRPVKSNGNNRSWPAYIAGHSESAGLGPNMIGASDVDGGTFHTNASDEGPYGDVFWRQIPRDMLESAKEFEKKFFAGTTLSQYLIDRLPNNAPGLWFAAVPGEPSDTSKTSTPFSDVDINEATLVRQRDQQCMDFRFEAAYPDYTLTMNPTYPDASVLGAGGGEVASDADFVARN